MRWRQYTKRNLTVAQHVALAQRVMAARDTIHDVLDLFPRDSRHGRAAWTIYRKLDTVRSGLDSVVYDLTAGCDPRNLAPTVYYGKGLVSDPDTAQTSTTKDAFAGWKPAPHEAPREASMTPETAIPRPYGNL
jgi:hypothetical protein